MVFAAEALRIALLRRLAVAFPPLLFRVDLRDGLPVAESSRRAPPLFWARIEMFLFAVWPPPTLRWLALTPGKAVSTEASFRKGRGIFALGGCASRCCWARNICAFVAMTRA